MEKLSAAADRALGFSSTWRKLIGGSRRAASKVPYLSFPSGCTRSWTEYPVEVSFPVFLSRVSTYSNRSSLSCILFYQINS